MSAAYQPRLTVIVRRDCHLCDDMVFALRELSPERQFSFELRDVDTDSELYRRYNVLVPVLLIGDEEICHYFLDGVALDEALAAARSAHRGTR